MESCLLPGGAVRGSKPAALGTDGTRARQDVRNSERVRSWWLLAEPTQLVTAEPRTRIFQEEVEI